MDEVATAVIADGDFATGLGDREGDGRDDLLVEVGETAWVTFGPLAGLVDETSLAGSIHFGLNCYDGTFWADAGDVDGDGEQDLVFQAEVYDPPGSAQSTSPYFAFYGPFD